MMRKFLIILPVLVIFGCQNRDINEGEEFRPRAVHDSFNKVEFSKVEVDGIEYLMLERDNNNPHEGFGFMALRANRLVEKQDSIIAHLNTISELQIRMYARMMGIPEEEARITYSDIFYSQLSKQQKELNSLQQEQLEGSDDR